MTISSYRSDLHLEEIFEGNFRLLRVSCGSRLWTSSATVRINQFLSSSDRARFGEHRAIKVINLTKKFILQIDYVDIVWLLVSSVMIDNDRYLSGENSAAILSYALGQKKICMSGHERR